MLPLPLPYHDNPSSYETIGKFISQKTHHVSPPYSDGRPGRLIPLRTLEEIRAAVQTTDCYTLPIPAKFVNAVLTSLRVHLSTLTTLQHLRRLVKPSFLPPSVLSKISPAAITAAYKSPTLYLLVCPTTDIPKTILESFFLALPVFHDALEGVEGGPRISTVPVPSCQPVSVEQANEWSERFWPTVYKRGNPYGPHPAIVENVAKKLGRAGEYIALAQAVGLKAAAVGIGRAFGCVVVDPETGDVVAAVGDGRCRVNKNGWENPLNHAAMRAMAMVAQRRLEPGVEVMPDNPVRPETAPEGKYFHTRAPTPISAVTSSEEAENIANGEGYLCHNMHIYLSHEPCVMCAMALLHSRVGVVVFWKRMLKTGALVAEDVDGKGDGYGLFWRPELNWKFLCWQWVDGEGEEEAEEEYVSV